MADHRHKRDTDARRKPRAAFVAGPLALFATISMVSLGVAISDAPASDTVTTRTTAADLREVTEGSTAGLSVIRETVLSRSAERRPEDKSKLERVLAKQAVAKAIKRADRKLWSTAELNLWTEPGKAGKKVGELAEEKKVLVTGRRLYGRDEVVVDGKARWVSRGYLSAEKPAEKPVEAEPVDATCSNGTSVPSGVSPNIVKVHQAVCANFPSITSYGTFRSDGEHAQGLAVDIMVSGDLGWQVAEFVRANYADLGVSYLIYSQRIWSVERGGEGWRPMSDRGSVTANHYDHVHVTTY